MERPEGGDGGADHLGHLGLVGDVSRHERGVATAHADRPDGRAARGLVGVDDHDARALRGEQHGRFPAHAVAATGDERDLAVEPPHAPQPTAGNPTVGSRSIEHAFASATR